MVTCIQEYAPADDITFKMENDDGDDESNKNKIHASLRNKLVNVDGVSVDGVSVNGTMRYSVHTKTLKANQIKETNSHKWFHFLNM